jgi:hypothetical protein
MKRTMSALFGFALALVGCAGVVEEEDGIGEAEGAYVYNPNPGPMPDSTEPTYPSTTVSAMMPFARDTTYEIVRARSDGSLVQVGFLFSYLDDTTSRQEQRWVLYGGPTLPAGEMSFRQPDAAHRFTSLSEWKGALGSIWQTGATYVKVTSTSAVRPSMDWETFDNDPNRPQVVDERSFEIFHVDAAGQQVLQGRVEGTDFTYPGGVMTNTEFWYTSASYVSQLSGSSRLRFASIVGERWSGSLGTGFGVTTVTCTYFTSLPSAL